MIENNVEKTLSRNLAKKLLPMALAIGILIAAVIPAGYFFLETARIKNEASAYANILAGNIRKLASEAPDLWKYQATKYTQMIRDSKNMIKSQVFLSKMRRVYRFPNMNRHYNHSLNGMTSLFMETRLR